MEYLDVEHYLNLLGFSGKNPVNEPSENHLIIKNSIAGVLRKKQDLLENPVLYKEFINLITSQDVLITLNYDTLLEDYYKKQKNKNFNFFPPHLIEEKLNYNNDSAILLKLHGSINWFDKFLKSVNTKIIFSVKLSLRDASYGIFSGFYFVVSLLTTLVSPLRAFTK